MKVTLVWQQSTKQDYPTSEQASTLTLEGSPEEVQQAIDKMFGADSASRLRHELGLKPISASDF